MKEAMRTMMKKSLLLMLFCSVAWAAGAQDNAIDRFYEEFKYDERFTRISVSSKMFSLFANFEMDDPAEKEMVETISKIKGLRMLVGDSIAGSREFYRNLVKQPRAEMEELMAVEDKHSEMTFWITESDGVIRELLMLMYGDDTIMMLSLVGDIDLQQISKLSSKMDIQGFEQLENLEER